MTAWTNKGQQAFHALLRQIQRPGMYFNLTPKYAPEPANIKGQSFASVQTNGTQVAGYALKLKGLPPSFPLAYGDFLSFPVNGAHRLFELATDVVTTPTGLATVTLTHPLTHGALPAPDTAVSFVNPTLTAKYIPGSMQAGAFTPGYAEGFSMGFIQATKIT